MKIDFNILELTAGCQLPLIILDPLVQILALPLLLPTPTQPQSSCSVVMAWLVASWLWMVLIGWLCHDSPCHMAQLVIQQAFTDQCQKLWLVVFELILKEATNNNFLCICISGIHNGYLFWGYALSLI